MKNASEEGSIQHTMPDDKNALSGAERARREGTLLLVFSSFDLDGNGEVEAKEVAVIATEKRILEMARGKSETPWTADTQERLMEKLDPAQTGLVQQRLFVDFFMEQWHGGMQGMDKRVFDDTCDLFKKIAAAHSVVLMRGAPWGRHHAAAI